MTDDPYDPDGMDELGELLSVADQPVYFAEPARSELLDQIIRTVSMKRTDPVVSVRPSEPVDLFTPVPFTTSARVARRPHRTWAVGVAASLILIITVALVVVAQQAERSPTPADEPLPLPMTVAEVCESLPPLAAANGLGEASVQIGDVSVDEVDEVRRLIARLSVDEGGPVASDTIADVITQIRLMEISIEASDTDAAANAMSAARASVAAVIDGAC